ncbi:hypothetical protein ACWCPQ_32265 [Nocardia sp. NPDC001965]
MSEVAAGGQRLDQIRPDLAGHLQRQAGCKSLKLRDVAGLGYGDPGVQVVVAAPVAQHPGEVAGQLIDGTQDRAAVQNPGQSAGSNVAGMTPDEEPEPWILRLPDAVFFLQEVLARQERLQLDFSPGSLAGLERYLARFEAPAEFRDVEDAEWIVEGAAGYVGETLLRLAGGGWAEQERPELFVVPSIHADPALGLEPINPLDLVDAATLGGDPLRRQYAAWAEAACPAAQVDEETLIELDDPSADES